MIDTDCKLSALKPCVALRVLVFLELAPTNNLALSEET